MSFRKNTIAAVAGLMLVVASAVPSRGDTLTVALNLNAGFSDVANGLFVYDAHVVGLPTDINLFPGDYFTIFDFNGFVAGSQSTPANWTPSSANFGPHPALVSTASDNPSIPNLTWTYTGPIIASPADFIGQFSAKSVFHSLTLDKYVSQDHQWNDATQSFLPHSHIADVIVPLAGTPSIPLPASLWSGLMLGAAGLIIRRKVR